MAKEISIQEKLEKIDALLAEYETSLGLPAWKENFHSDLTEYISMDRKAMEKLSPNDCAEIAHLLSQYIFHLQRAQNREIARANWAEQGIKQAIAGELSNFRGSYSQQSDQAIKQNDYAQSLLKLKIGATQRSDRINFLATSIRNIRDDYRNLQQAKRGLEQ